MSWKDMENLAKEQMEINPRNASGYMVGEPVLTTNESIVVFLVSSTGKVAAFHCRSKDFAKDLLTRKGKLKSKTIISMGYRVDDDLAYVVDVEEGDRGPKKPKMSKLKDEFAHLTNLSFPEKRKILEYFRSSPAEIAAKATA